MELLDYLERAVKDNASDLFIVAGAPVSEKLEGRLSPMGEKIFPDETERLIRDLYRQADRDIETHFIQQNDDDFSLSVKGLARFRVNTYKQRGSMAAVIRVVQFKLPDWEKFRIPSQVMEAAKISHGMVLVTGTAGSGKSTTLACIIDRINHTRTGHIITLEDPIEFLHSDDQCIISQREVAIDTQDYVSALRACLRQAPNVILLGEMRDADTIRTAITAAETGHLVFATLHTKGAANAIDRIVDSFPSTQQEQIRVQLASELKTVVSQQLVQDVYGEQVPVFEIMNMTDAIRANIRKNDSKQIENIISEGEEGMISMDQSLIQLYQAGEISRETALDACNNKSKVERCLR